jgi:hypothetical protein
VDGALVDYMINMNCVLLWGPYITTADGIFSCILYYLGFHRNPLRGSSNRKSMRSFAIVVS